MVVSDTVFQSFANLNQIKNAYNMLQIPVKEGESIERALKKYKKKFEKTGVLKQLRERKQFTKKSVLRRQEIIKAEYVERMHSEE